MEQVPGKVLLDCVTALCTAAWVTSGDQIEDNEVHEMTRKEISLINTDIHEIKENLRAVESK